MTALTAARETERKDGVIVARPLIAQEIIYKGAPVLLNATSKLAFSNDGTTNTLAAGDAFGGIAVETMDNSAGAASDKLVRSYCVGLFLMKFPAGDNISQDDVGKDVYVNNVTDDSEVTITVDGGGVDLKIGKIEIIGDVAATAWVRIDGQIGNVAA